MKKRIPKFKSDKEAEEFLEKDLTDYIDLKNFRKVSFEFQPKTKKVNIRFPEKLLDAVRKEAKRHSIPKIYPPSRGAFPGGIIASRLKSFAERAGFKPKILAPKPNPAIMLDTRQNML